MEQKKVLGIYPVHHINDDDYYTAPLTDQNLEALLNADYSVPSLVVLYDEENDPIAIKTTEIEGFRVEYSDEDDDTDEETDELLVPLSSHSSRGGIILGETKLSDGDIKLNDYVKADKPEEKERGFFHKK